MLIAEIVFTNIRQSSQSLPSTSINIQQSRPQLQTTGLQPAASTVQQQFVQHYGGQLLQPTSLVSIPTDGSSPGGIIVLPADLPTAAGFQLQPAVQFLADGFPADPSASFFRDFSSDVFATAVEHQQYFDQVLRYSFQDYSSSLNKLLKWPWHCSYFQLCF